MVKSTLHYTKIYQHLYSFAKKIFNIKKYLHYFTLCIYYIPIFTKVVHFVIVTACAKVHCVNNNKKASTGIISPLLRHAVTIRDTNAFPL